MKGLLPMLFYTLFLASSLCSLAAYAQQVPGSADPARIDPFAREAVMPEQQRAPLSVPQISPSLEIPPAAAQVKFRLKEVKIEGVTAFSQQEMADLYTRYLGNDISLEVIWMIAGRITERYQNQGYFLSRAIIPAQEIENGTVRIKVVEGYIGEIDFADSQEEQPYVIHEAAQQLQQQRPVTSDQLESFVLTLNALPGSNYRALAEPLEEEEGAIRLILTTQEDATPKGLLSLDNFGSRFLGPYQATASWQHSFFPLQETTFSALSSLPTDELNYLAARHRVPLYPNLELLLSGHYVTSEPGSTLEANAIESSSARARIGLQWHAIRQRDENLSTELALRWQNTNSDILRNVALTRDRVRVLEWQLNYDMTDGWSGYNDLQLSVHQGLEVLAASNAGDLNLSRAEAEPDFTTISLDYMRQQAITADFLAVARMSGQWADGALYSSEEFGYGGQAFGRAYNPSELTGDKGIITSLELRYLGVSPWQNFRLTPFGFYDIGRVWNEDAGGSSESGSTAGFGAYWNYDDRISGQIGLAFPLTREASSPLYGDGKQPRLLLQLQHRF